MAIIIASQDFQADPKSLNPGWPLARIQPGELCQESDTLDTCHFIPSRLSQSHFSRESKWRSQVKDTHEKVQDDHRLQYRVSWSLPNSLSMMYTMMRNLNNSQLYSLHQLVDDDIRWWDVCPKVPSGGKGYPHSTPSFRRSGLRARRNTWYPFNRKLLWSITKLRLRKMYKQRIHWSPSWWSSSRSRSSSRGLRKSMRRRKCCLPTRIPSLLSWSSCWLIREVLMAKLIQLDDLRIIVILKHVILHFLHTSFDTRQKQACSLNPSLSLYTPPWSR